jgi:hypothetical protein
MSWSPHLSAGTIKGREKELQLRGEYEIRWKDYSNLDIKFGAFKYALIKVGVCNNGRIAYAASN